MNHIYETFWDHLLSSEMNGCCEEKNILEKLRKVFSLGKIDINARNVLGKYHFTFFFYRYPHFWRFGEYLQTKKV